MMGFEFRIPLARCLLIGVAALAVTMAAPGWGLDRPAAHRFDFGLEASPVAAGYVQVTPQTAYAPVLGYGWEAPIVGGRDRWLGSDLERDFAVIEDATFVVDAPVATYDVTLTIGDIDFGHNEVGIFLEGVQVDLVTTAVGGFLTKTYRVLVDDGQLTVRLADMGGTDPYAVLNGLMVGARKVASTHVPVHVGNLQTATSTLIVDGLAGRIADVNVTVDIAHRYDADLDVYLISPAGTRVELFTDIGDNGDDFHNTVLDDQAEMPVFMGTAPFTGSFQPEGWLGNLVGDDPNGTWTLEVSDDAGGDTGTLLGWSIELDLDLGVQPYPTKFDFGSETSPLAAGHQRVSPTTGLVDWFGYGWTDGVIGSRDRIEGPSLTRDLVYTDLATFAVSVPRGRYDVTITVGDLTVEHDDMAFYLEGNLVDMVSTAAGEFIMLRDWVDVYDGQLTLTIEDLGGLDGNVVVNGLALRSMTEHSQDVPKAVADLQTILSTLNVAGFFGPITDLDVDLTIQHTYDADLHVFLISPAGTRVELFTDVDSTGRGFIETLLDDEASTSILAGAAPFTGRFRPEGSLSDLDGEDANGTWTLEVTDGTPGHTGALVAWALIIESELKLDFGMSYSPVAPGYARVTSATFFDGLQSYGWVSGWVDGRSRDGQDPLLRDFNFSPEAVFAVAVPDGAFDLTLTMGDMCCHQDNVGIYLEGEQVDTVFNVVNQFITNTYRVTVEDGQLTLGIKDLGGTDLFGRINALELK